MNNIYLDLNPYCDGCNDFQAAQERTEIICEDNTVRFSQTRLTCENAGKCKSLYEYLKAKQKDSVAVVLKDMEEHFAYLCETGNLPNCPEWEGEVFATIDKNLTKAGYKK